MDDPGLADLKTVVTEACMNVVVHAYEGEPGPLNVEAEPDVGRTDGDRPRPGHRDPAAGRTPSASASASASR